MKFEILQTWKPLLFDTIGSSTLFRFKGSEETLAHILLVKDGEVTIKRYWDLSIVKTPRGW
jgi:hypothetical protein